MTKMFFGGVSLTLFAWISLSAEAPKAPGYMQDPVPQLLAAR